MRMYGENGNYPYRESTPATEAAERAEAYAVEIANWAWEHVRWLNVRTWCELSDYAPPKVCIGISDDAPLGENDGEYTLAEMDRGTWRHDLIRLLHATVVEIAKCGK